MSYKLLTPGPLTTSMSVKNAMLVDSCTWSYEYKEVVQSIRSELLKMMDVEDTHTIGLIQGSGTYAVESALLSSGNEESVYLVLENGAYGERITEILNYAKRKVITVKCDEQEVVDLNDLETHLLMIPAITHVVAVHCETTTGILNPIEEIISLASKYDKVSVIDAMSSLFGVQFAMNKLSPDYVITSSNKCIEGVPGFGIVYVKKALLETMRGNAQSLSLDLYEQIRMMDLDPGKWRFTSPTHVVLAFNQALKELKLEGVENRYLRYQSNQKLLVKLMREIGYETCIESSLQSTIITTFMYYDDESFTFMGLYEFLKDNGFVIYPGKLSDLNVFRIGNIGQIYETDIIKLCELVSEYTRGLK